MSGERPAIVRAEDELKSFREHIERLESEDEPLNLILSERCREAVELYLKGMAEAMALDKRRAMLIGEMAISRGAEELPHATKGQFREALTEYLTDQRMPTTESAIGELDNDGKD